LLFSLHGNHLESENGARGRRGRGVHTTTTFTTQWMVGICTQGSKKYPD